MARKSILSEQTIEQIIELKKSNKYIPATAIIEELNLPVGRHRVHQILKKAEAEGKL